MNAVTVKNLTKVFRQGDEDIYAVDYVSFTVAPGEMVAVVGQSGSGKTTLLNLIGGIEHPTSGSVEVGGVDICSADDETLSGIRRRKLGYIFQDFNLLPILTAEENIIMPLLLDGKKPDKTKLRELAGFLGIENRLKHLPSELSGGQKQRVAIAGVMAMKPRCIVLDEPTAMLDPNGRREVIKTVHELNRQEGITVVLITHYMEEVIDADRVVVIDGGHVVMDGTPKEVFSRVKELKKYSLDVPQVTELADELKEAGMDLPYGILSIDELVDELVPLLK